MIESLELWGLAHEKMHAHGQKGRDLSVPSDKEEKTMRKIVLTAVGCLFLFSSFIPLNAAGTNDQASPAPPAQWTILVFMNGDNNLEHDALINFKQLSTVGSTKDVNVIVQFDRIAKYDHRYGNWPQTLRFRITKDLDPLPANALQDIGEADMGDGKVLADFVIWGMREFPANHYMLIVWDHGQGWRLFTANFLKRQREVLKSRAMISQLNVTALRAQSVLFRNSEGIASSQGQTAPFRSAPGAPYRSVSNDETNQDVLYNRKIQDSLEAALGGKRIDIIGFDACLMSMVETAYALRNISHFMVASEELEPGLGWKYDDWLAALETNPNQDARAVAKMTVDKYREAYTSPTSGDPATTLAAFDLTHTVDLTSAISALSDSLSGKLDSETQAIIEARAATMTYAPGYVFYHVDLGEFLTQLSGRTTDQLIHAKIEAVRDRPPQFLTHIES